MRAGQAFSVAAEFRSAAGGSRCEYVCMVFLVGRYVYFRRTHFFARLWCLCGRGSRLTIVNPFPQIRTWIRTRSEPTVPGCARCELLWSDWGGGETASLSLSLPLSVPLCSVPPCVFNSSTMVLGGCGKLLSSAYCYRLARGVNLRYFQEGPKTYLFVYKQGDVSNVQLCNVSLFLLHQFFLS